MIAIPDAAMSRAAVANAVTPASVGSRLAIRYSFQVVGLFTAQTNTVPEPFPKPLPQILADHGSDGKGVELRGVEPLASRVRF